MHVCDISKRAFIIDDKGFLKCFNFVNVFKQIQIPQNKKSRDSVFSKSNSLVPKFKEIEITCLWSFKAHNEQIKSLEYILKENILITTAYDKKVKLWDSVTGDYVDSFQQNYDRKEPKPIAWKKLGTQEIYSSHSEERFLINLKKISLF